jgi:hypothetical protein
MRVPASGEGDGSPGSIEEADLTARLVMLIVAARVTSALEERPAPDPPRVHNGDRVFKNVLRPEGDLTLTRL